MSQEYHGSVSASDTPRKLGPYEFIATPPIQLVLDAITEHCGVGGSITPGVRVLADWSSVSRGLITDCLRTLATDEWILYDGRVITLLRSPDETAESDRSGDRSLGEDGNEVIDHPIDHAQAQAQPAKDCDRSGDRSPLRAAIERFQMRQNPNDQRDRSADRSLALDVHPPHTPPMVIHDLAATESAVAHESSTTGGSGGTLLIDQPIDRWPPAAQVMAELGADVIIIADALSARPDYSPQQVRDLWEWCQDRIERSAGRLGEGIFCHALRSGQLAPTRPQGVDWSAYAEAADESPPVDESPHDRARRILPDGASGHDFVFLVGRLASGDSDDQALAALAARRARLRGAA